MTPGLILRYEFRKDGDDFGWLELDVRTEDFSGRGGFWVQWQDVVEFGEELAQYPIPADGIERSWGYRENDVDETVLACRIRPANGRGALDVHVMVADQYEPKRSVSALFRTNYPDVERFRGEIDRMMKREAAEAALTGRPE